MTMEGYSHDDDEALKYINQMLMEEDMEEKTCMFQDLAALQAAEKSFYEVLEGKCHPSPDHHQIHHVEPNSDNPHECYGIADQTNYNTSSSVTDLGLICDRVEYEPPPVQTAANEFALESTSRSSLCSSSSGGNVIDALMDSFGAVNAEKKYESEYSLDGLRGNKNARHQEFDLEEGRSNKQLALSMETDVGSELFDMVLLSSGCHESLIPKAILQNKMNKDMHQNSRSKELNNVKEGKKRGGKRNVVDLTTTLTLCAQAVSAGFRSSANELLKQIRQHSSPLGDGMQRMAHYFADGLEARMAGSGTQSYKLVTTKLASAAEMLKAYCLYIACSPFTKVTNFFANKTILNLSQKAMRLHIVDFGILYGFQWPSLLQRLSSRPGGPPKVRITGIDFPNSGFRPAERVEETGRRLADYAARFNIPFEFNALAQKWEMIQLEDLKLDKDEVLVVNCQCRLRNLLDETVVMDSPRDIVLKLIRKMNPDVFLQGVVSGSHNAPFFISRFREAIFHYSSLFDMLDATVPREVHDRMLLEKQMFGWEAMNVISCEGAERIERPETYKQWQVRNLRAGFTQLPLDREMMRMIKEMVKKKYNKHFMVDDYGQWMLLGWKGRYNHALSSWKPAF